MATLKLPELHVMSRTSWETFAQEAPTHPYVTFTLGPGKLQRLTVKIWSHDQGCRDDPLVVQDPYANSHTFFCFGLVSDASSTYDSSNDLLEFQRNVRSSSRMRCYTNEWNFDAPAEEDDSANRVHGWIASLAETKAPTVGVFPLARSPGWVNSVWQVEVRVAMRPSLEDQPPESRTYIEHGYDRETLMASPIRQHLQEARLIGIEEKMPIIDSAIRRALDDHPDRVSQLDDVVRRLLNRYLRTRAIADLEEAITITRRAIEGSSKDHPDRARRLNNLGSLLSNKHSHTGALADLEESITTIREAVGTMPHDNDDRPTLLNNLGARLGNRYSHTEAMADLAEAITVIREAVKATPDNHPGRARRLNDLGVLLDDRYQQTQSIADLEEAITVTRAAVKAAPNGHPVRGGLLSNLGVQLGNKYSYTGAMEDLEESISMLREGARATSDHHPGRAILLNNLGIRLGDRYLRTGDAAGLEEAISTLRKAVKATPNDHPDLAGYLNNLGVRLNDRYAHTGAMADLEEAIDVTYNAVRAQSKDHPDRGVLLNSLGVQLGDRYLSTGAMVDLEKAITLLRKAVEATPDNHPARASQLNNLGVRIGNRYLKTGSMEDLEEAITVIRGAAEATPHDHPDLARRLNNLGLRLGNRYLRRGNALDLEEANARFKDALHCRRATTSERIQSGLNFMSSPNVLKDTAGAFTVAETTVNLIPLLSPFSLQSVDKHNQLRKAVGIASNAAAIGLHSGCGPLAALQLLETGRGVLASSLHSIRTDLSTLQQTYPGLARSFVDLRDQLDAPYPRSSFQSSRLGPMHTTSVDRDRRHKASTQMEQLLGEIRRQPGFERFLTSLTKEKMHEAAASGPIVVINVSAHGCDALLIESSDIRVLHLPQLNPRELTTRSDSAGSIGTLAWLWDVAVGPILDALGFTGPPTDNVWPHVWWIPTGSLTRFPLHAAGHHAECSAETALDRAVSSYSPSIKSMLHSRQHRRQDATASSRLNVVLVNMNETPDRSGLLHATRETVAVREVCRSMGLTCDQPSTCKKDILAALEDCFILHFAGHGLTHPEPLQSHLLLQDWQNDPLTVESLLDTNLSANAPFLAYLSACGTGRIQDERSIDESIHLASAFQLAGFRHVIGTMWGVDDELCVDVARLTYEFVGTNGLGDESLGRGLHHATKTLRDRWLQQKPGTEPDVEGSTMGGRDAELCAVTEHDRPLWVPYVHFGV